MGVREWNMAPRVPEQIPLPAESADPEWVKNVKKDVKYDQTSVRRESMFALPKAIHDMVDPKLADPRDAIMLDLMFNISILVLPSALLQFMLPAALSGWPKCMGILHIAI